MRLGTGSLILDEIRERVSSSAQESLIRDGIRDMNRNISLDYGGYRLAKYTLP